MNSLYRLRLSSAQKLVMSFALLIVFGAFLLTLPAATVDGKGLGLIDALFEATSAVCVTGLVVVDTGTDLTTFGQVVIVLLVQLGGLGFMTFATFLAVMMGKRIGLKERLLMQESLNQVNIEGVIKLTKRVILTTLAIEAVAALLLFLIWLPQMGVGKALYFGVFHAITAFCNAGFDLFGEYASLTSQVNNWGANLIIGGLIILGGIGFTVMADIYFKRNWEDLSLHSKIVLGMSGFLLAFGTLVILLVEYSNPSTLGALSLSDKILAAFFQSLTPRTAGFNTLDLTKLHVITQFLLIILMFIGASPNSTGGGIKTTTLGAVLLAVWAVLRGREDIEIFKRRIPRETVFRALAIVTIAIFTVLFATAVLAYTDEGDFMKILFEVVSALGTVGLSLGLTPTLSVPGKLVIMIVMFLGRVGPLTLATALMNPYERQAIRQPEAKIMVG